MDPEFEPTNDHLCEDKETFDLKFRNYSWSRASEIPELLRQGKLEIFKDSIEPDDIQQGALGDCYFLTCLSALAEHPKRILKLFVAKETSEHCIYAVKMTKNGLPIEVVIDDFIPVRNGRPAFS